MVNANNKNIKQIVMDGINNYGPNADLNYIDTSEVTNMRCVFSDIKNFNGDISRWDVSNVRDMSFIFSCSIFNGDISRWDVSNVKTMQGMFYNSMFNGDISEWDTHNVIYMKWMFACSRFNNDISLWNISNVKDMSHMFYMSAFNKKLNIWNISDDIYTYHMLYNIIYDKEILWDVDLEELFGNKYDGYMERRKLCYMNELICDDKIINIF